MSQSAGKNRKLDSKKIRTHSKMYNSNIYSSQRAIVPTVASFEHALLSRLRRFPNTRLNENGTSSRLRESYSSVAEATKKTLISKITSKEAMDDIEFMVDLANSAFDTLMALQHDFSDLYDAIKDYISYQCQLSDAVKERERNESKMESLIRPYKGIEWLRKSSKPLCRAKTNLAEASADVAATKARVRETRDLLKRLEEKLESGNRKVDCARAEVDELERAYEAAKAKLRDVASEIRELEKVKEGINARCEDARAGIDRAKAMMLNL